LFDTAFFRVPGEYYIPCDKHAAWAYAYCPLLMPRLSNSRRMHRQGGQEHAGGAGLRAAGGL
jgi:hypothetical protein